ncbi:MAG: DUF6768 family protein [Planctomycetota bacterium]
MNELDEQIRAALSAEEADTLAAHPSETSLASMILALYQGRRWWINLIATLMTLVVFALQILCGIKFFQADTTQQWIGWATGFLFLFMWVLMMKIWFWLELLRNSVTREIKRLELQVAMLNQSQDH